ncbi:GPW/gp25 family protein [Streptomyces sp. WZ-12]|uniref:GPW/gp25 family protein n=1 Tax=Streptomyces sp. WZ-12 TaxID=3030210 RepID=UPI0023816036|nr:GPW/gp25 family protein [Streptomyces sp. WZ-12]
MNDTALIGRGWTHPATFNADATVALTSGPREIEQAIHIILTTRLGERAMRPEFGCNVHSLLFAPLDATTAGQAVYETQTALERWEPRIEVDHIGIATDDTTPGLMYIDIRYRIRSTNSIRNLVFPFYVIPEETTPNTGGG